MEVPIVVQQIALFLGPAPPGATDIAADGSFTSPEKEKLARQTLLDQLWSASTQPDADPNARTLRAACGLAALDPVNPRWSDIRERVVDQLVRVRPTYITYWQGSLRPVGKQLAKPLAAACRDQQLSETERTLATFAYDHPILVADKEFVDAFHGSGWSHVTPVTYIVDAKARIVKALRGHQTLETLRAATH